MSREGTGFPRRTHPEFRKRDRYLKALLRRAAYLDTRVQGSYPPGKEGHVKWDKEELAALRWAIEELERGRGGT